MWEPLPPPPGDECPPGGEASRVWRPGGHSQTVSQPWKTWLCLRLPPTQGLAGIFLPCVHPLAGSQRGGSGGAPGKCSREVLLRGAPGRCPWGGALGEVLLGGAPGEVLQGIMVASRRLTRQSWRPEVKVRSFLPLCSPWCWAAHARHPWPVSRRASPGLASSSSPCPHGDTQA